MPAETGRFRGSGGVKIILQGGSLHAKCQIRGLEVQAHVESGAIHPRLDRNKSRIPKLTSLDTE
jgi:hypothetical protein